MLELVLGPVWVSEQRQVENLAKKLQEEDAELVVDEGHS